MAKVVIAGASGFIGKHLIDKYRAAGDQVVLIGRTSEVTWSDREGILRAVDGADLLINMAGKNVGCRYTDANRNEILRSRVHTTRALLAAVEQCENPPKVWLNSATATIYRHATDRPQTESTGEIGKGFSVDVARNWEREFFAGELSNTRRVALRMAVLLGDGPATKKLMMLAKFGLGGPQFDGRWIDHKRYRGIGPDPTNLREGGLSPYYASNGNQMFSWLHIEDVLRAIDFIVETPSIEGPINLAAPNPVPNRELMRQLRQIVKAPVGLPAYRWMLEPAMFLIRQEPEMLLKSRWVLPERLEAAGFEFKWPELGAALADVR